MEARPVRVARVSLRPMERTLPATGWLAAREETTLAVKVSGRIKTISVDLGSTVKAGDVMAQVEPRDYELRVQQATAALAQTRAALGLSLEGDDDRVKPEETPGVRQARAVLDEAKLNLERVRNLSKEGISPQSELDTAEATHTVAREKYETALQEARTRQATLAQRRAELELARQQLADTVVRAPFDGAIQARLADLGEYQSAGSPVATLVQTDPLRLRLEISEREASRVEVGQLVRVSVEGDPVVQEGRIARVSPALNEANRMLMVEADLPSRGRLRPGLFVKAQIVLRQDEPALVVPANSLVVFAGIEKVVAVTNGVAQERGVVTGRRTDGAVEIVSGLQPGELIVIDPGGTRTGQRVRPTNEAPLAAVTKPALSDGITDDAKAR